MPSRDTRGLNLESLAKRLRGPEAMVTNTSFLRNRHYHRPSDRPETLDYPFLARVTAGVVHALELLLRG